ncbi:DNA polymerase V/Myb-binding protein 1A [Fusarium oxysporum f. sp. vasinfectum]|nr:DNA polymerase V/Myb-binding protein 1A [Fusarium oxysporum f. sp. vasinfectum]
MGSKRKRGAKEGTNGAQKAPKRTKSDNESVRPSSKPAFDKSPFVEAPIGDERKREAGLYDLLGSEDPDERIEAADCIVPSLLAEGVSETVLQRHLDRRLFRGLASGRNASRLGFSLVLTEVLGQLFGEKNLAESRYQGLTFEKILEILIENTQAIGNLPGQEERDFVFGRLFGIFAFVRSGILFSDISRWNAVLDLILDLSSRKVWLRPQCGWVIVQSIEQLNKKQAETTLEKVAVANLAKTPEGVAIWIAAQTRFPGLRIKPWPVPLHKNTFGDLAAILRESFKDSFADQSEPGQQINFPGWSPQLHYVWSILLEHFLEKREAGLEDFKQFWTRVVDDSLFSKRATEGQKFRGFMVLFSKNLTLCLMNQASKEDRYLHRAANKALKAIEATTSAHPATLVPILKGLLGENGAYNFDQRTNTKTVDQILQNVSGETGEEILKIIRTPLSTIAKQDTKKASSTLRVYVDYLSKILNASASPTSGEFQQTVFSAALQELSQLAYSQPKNIPVDTLTEGVRELCRTRLESSFAKVSRRTEDYGSLCLAVSSIDPNSVAMTEEIKTAVQEALSRMQKLLRRKAGDDSEKNLFQSIAMLHAVSIFRLYNEDPDAMEVLNDLAQCSDRLEKGKSAESEAGTSEIILEILLSMVVRPSSLMRQVTQQIDSDVEFIDIKETNDESGEDEEDEADDEDEDGEKSKGEFDRPEDLDNELEKILNSHRLDKDVNAESSDSEGDMSDSEMFAIDEQLAAAIKPRIQDRSNDSKKQKKEAKQSVLNFKNRILDFIDIYVRNESRSPLSFTLLLPLLDLMRTTSTKPLAARASKIISNYQKGLKKARSNRQEVQILEPDDMLDLLREIHKAASQDDSHAYAKAASTASLIVVSALVAADKSKMEDILAVYSKTQASCFSGEVKLQSSFIGDWQNWYRNAMQQVRN